MAYIYILTFNLTFFLVYTLTFYLTFYLASILTYFLDFSSIIIVRHCFLHSIYSGILSGIYSGILSGMCSGPGRHGQLPPELAIGFGSRRGLLPPRGRGDEEEKELHLSKSRDPHLTGGEKLHVCTYIYIYTHIYIYSYKQNLPWGPHIVVLSIPHSNLLTVRVLFVWQSFEMQLSGWYRTWHT